MVFWKRCKFYVLFFLFGFSPCAWHFSTPLGFEQWARVLPWLRARVPSQVVMAVAMLDNRHGCLNPLTPPPFSPCTCNPQP